MDSYSTMPTNGEGETSFGYKEHNQVRSFLTGLYLDQYTPIFLEEGFESVEAVKEITEEDLIALNVKRGHRRIIQRGIATLNGIPQNQPLMVMSPTTPTSAAVNAAVAATSQQGAAVSQQQPSTIMRSKANNGNNSSEGSSYTTSGYGSVSSPRYHQTSQQQQYESSNSSGNNGPNTLARGYHNLHMQQQQEPLIIQQHTQSLQPQHQQQKSNGATIADETRSTSFSSNDEEDNDDDVNTPPKRKYRRHPKPDKNAPIKPPSAYIMFSNDARARLKDHNMTFVEIAKLVGDQWKNLSMHQKQQYERTAMRAKDDYIDALNTYRQTDEYKNYQIYLNNFKSEQDAANRKIARLRKRSKRESSGSGSMADSSSNGNDNNNIKNRRSDGSLGSSNSSADGGSNDNARSFSSSGSTDIYKVHLKNNPPPTNGHSHNNHSSSTMTKATSSSEEENDSQHRIMNLIDNNSPDINEGESMMEDQDEDEGNGDECYSPQQKAPPLVTNDQLIKTNYHRLPFTDSHKQS